MIETETKGFLGERLDEDAGLQFLNARYYDPALGIFIQPDWFEVTKAGVGTNRYRYSFNDPVNLRDPGGNATVGCLDNCALFARDTDNEIERLTNERENDPQHSDKWYEKNIDILKKNSAAYHDLAGLSSEERAVKFAQSLVEQGSAAIVPAGQAASPIAKTQASNFAKWWSQATARKKASKAKNLVDLLGSKELKKIVEQVNKGLRPLSDLTPRQRELAAAFFEKTKSNVGGKYAKAAAELQQRRVDFLRGTSNIVPGQLPQLLKRK